MKKRINEELYDIYYDYEDEEGYIYRDNKEEFEGDWLELQDYINSMRRNGCYNIDAVYREGSSGEYDYELEEDIADNDIEKVYRRLSKLNKVDFGALEDEYLNQRPSVKDAVYKFYGTVLNMKSYCNDFAKWVKEEKGIDLKGLPCKKNEELKEEVLTKPDFLVGVYELDDETLDEIRKIDDVEVFMDEVKELAQKYNRGSDINKYIDKFTIEDVEADTYGHGILGSYILKVARNKYKRTPPAGTTYDFHDIKIVNKNNLQSRVQKLGRFLGKKLLSREQNESLKEGINKKDIAKRLVQLAYDYDYYDFMDSLEVGETMEDAIIRIERDLDNPKYVRGIIRWLKEVANDEYIKGDDISQEAKRLIKELRGER